MVAEESEESEADEDQSWKKGAAPRKQPKTVYEVLKEDEETKPQKILGILSVDYLCVFSIVICDIEDMRGPQPRVVTTTADASAGHEVKKHAGPLPELRHNMRELVDLAERKIRNADWREKQERDRMALLEHERERMEDQVQAELKRIVSFF